MVPPLAKQSLDFAKHAAWEEDEWFGLYATDTIMIPHVGGEDGQTTVHAQKAYGIWK